MRSLTFFIPTLNSETNPAIGWVNVIAVSGPHNGDGLSGIMELGYQCAALTTLKHRHLVVDVGNGHAETPKYILC